MTKGGETIVLDDGGGEGDPDADAGADNDLVMESQPSTIDFPHFC